jgi:hypothetical protein
MERVKLPGASGCLIVIITNPLAGRVAPADASERPTPATRAEPSIFYIADVGTIFEVARPEADGAVLLRPSASLLRTR